MTRAVRGKFAEDELMRTVCCRPINGRVVGSLQTVSCLENVEQDTHIGEFVA